MEQCGRMLWIWKWFWRMEGSSIQLVRDVGQGTINHLPASSLSADCMWLLSNLTLMCFPPLCENLVNWLKTLQELKPFKGVVWWPVWSVCHICIYVIICEYIFKYLSTGAEGNSEFCFPWTSVFPLTLSGTLRFKGNKIHCSARDQSISDLLYSNKWVKLVEKHVEIPAKTSGHLQLHALIMCNSGQHFAGNSELFPIWRHSFCNVACSWHVLAISFIVDVIWPWASQ